MRNAVKEWISDHIDWVVVCSIYIVLLTIALIGKFELV